MLTRTRLRSTFMADFHEHSIDSCVRGYHAYKGIWTPEIGDSLLCRREPRNAVDRYAVAVVKADGTIVGHLPKKISLVSSLFIRREGLISCEITGSRRPSRDLIQGGLEIPCRLVFKCKEKKELSKLVALMKRE